MYARFLRWSAPLAFASLLGVPASAANMASIEATDAQALPGAAATVEIRFVPEPGYKLISLDFHMHFDPRLTFQSSNSEVQLDLIQGWELFKSTFGARGSFISNSSEDPVSGERFESWSYAPNTEIELTGPFVISPTFLVPANAVPGTQYSIRFKGELADTNATLFGDEFDKTVTITAVPEPETYALFGAGLALLWTARRRHASLTVQASTVQ